MDETIKLPACWEGMELTELIGTGAYGSVYSARFLSDTQEEEDCAVKIIKIPANATLADHIAREHPDREALRAYYKELVDSLLFEIKTMEQLKENPNAVKMLDYCLEEDENGLGWTIFIRMELLTTFEDYCVYHELEEKDVIALGIDLCNVLSECGRIGIIHRDIKPENIMADEAGHFKLGDFGIARKIEQTTSGFSMKGTYFFMAPEVYHGETYDARVDQYSLGLVLYRLMNRNRDPFVNVTAGLVSYKMREDALQERMKGEVIPEPCDASENFARIIKKACSYRPDNRFASIDEMKAALECCFEDKPVIIDGIVELSEEEQEKLQEKKNFRKRIYTILATAGLLLVSFAGFLIMTNRKTPEEQAYIESQNFINQIEAGNNVRDNALYETDISSFIQCYDSSDQKEDAELIREEILRFEEAAKQSKDSDRSAYEKTTAAVFYLDETQALGLSVNYNVLFQNETNRQIVQDLYTLYYFEKTVDGNWNRRPNAEIPEDLLSSAYEAYLPEKCLNAMQQERNAVCNPEAFWVGTDAVYENGLVLKIGAIWQNEDGSMDVYVICKNGTPSPAEEYAYWFLLQDEELGTIVSQWGHLDPGSVHVPVNQNCGYSMHIEAEDLQEKDLQWNPETLNAYLSGNNSNYR